MHIQFTAKEYAWIEAEFGYTRAQVDRLRPEELSDLANDCFVIEEVETVAAGEGDLSERGEIAAGIVTKVNA